MKAIMYVRALSPVEQAGLEAGLRSPNAFTLRRSQIVLASSRGQRPSEIAHNLGCAMQTVRNTLHVFEANGLTCLKQQSSRPKTIHAEFDQQRREGLRAMLHQRPPAHLWETDQCLDAQLGSAGLPGTGLDGTPGEH